MKKFKMRSKSLKDENARKLMEIFPGCVTEVCDEDTGEITYAIDFENLSQELSDSVIEKQKEKYHLTWPGKQESIAVANKSINKTLRPILEESCCFDDTNNIFVEGNNIHVLKLLHETYLGRVKLIYIDPPYNTGKDFIYKDNFIVTNDEHDISTGQRNLEGDNLVANKESDGRFHSNWLSMIAPLLRLAKGFLTQDGAIFISCDEGEHPRLRLVMDEIFGQQNFVGDLVWKTGQKNNSSLISVTHEYIVCYARDVNYLSENDITWRQQKKGLDEIYDQYNKLKSQYGDDYDVITTELKAWYKSLPDNAPSKCHKHYSHADSRGIYFPDNISSPSSNGPKYEVLHPKTKKPVKIPQQGWRITKRERMMELIEDDRIHFGADESRVPCRKSYLSDIETQVLNSVFYKDGRAASKRLQKLMGGKVFNFPKDEFILQEFVEIVTNSDDIVLDFFAGSSTTAHSVMLQNAKDGKNRKFIMVQCNEFVPEKSEAKKLGYKSIPEISRKRIKLAGKEILDGDCHPDWDKDIGFRALKLDSSNMEDIYYTPEETSQSKLERLIDNVKSDRNEFDILFQILIDLGIELSLPIKRENIDGNNIFIVDDYLLVACLSGKVNDNLANKIVKNKPRMVIFRDFCFESDKEKINVEQIFRRFSPNTEVRSL